MSEANRIVVTVGPWVGAFLALLVWSLLGAYISRSIDSRTEIDSLLLIRKDIDKLYVTEIAKLDVLLRLERLVQDNPQLRNRHRP